MSRIVTANQLADALDRSSSWRVKEIVDIKTTIQQVRDKRIHTLNRAAIPVFYAHWEGFVKSATQCYIEFVSSQSLSVGLLQPEMAVRCAIHSVDGLLSLDTHSACLAVAKFLRHHSADTTQLSCAVDAKGNLKYKVFLKILASVGIDNVRYQTKHKFIDVELLKNRNEIAHGEHTGLASEDTRAIADQVLELIEWYKTDILNQASLRCFEVR